MTKKHLLLGSVSALAVTLLAVPMVAQDQLETVVVTGIRASLQSAQAIKQNSDQVVDSITSVDIGALPDRNVAEALQRVPGVTLQRTDSANDPTRYGSTGSSVFVRGLSWVQSLMNGRDEFSAVDGRTLSFADVSADLLSGVDVYKNPTAKMIEGGVGGVVDLKTRKPFDQSGRVMALSGDYTYGDLSDRALPSFNALYSDRWTTSIGEIGFLASVDWQDQITRTEGININPYDCWDVNSSSSTYGHHYDANDSGYSSCMDQDAGSSGRLMGPDGWAWRQMEFKQQRLAANVVLQYRPNEHWEFTLSGLNTYAHQTDVEHYVYLVTTSSTSSLGTFNGSGSTFDSKGNWTGGEASLSSIDTRAGTGHNRNTDVNFNAKWNPNDNWEVTADVQFVEASSPYRNVTMYTALTSGLVMDLDLSKGDPKISYTNDGSTSTASNYQWNAAMDHMRYNVAHAGTARLDVTHTFSDNGLFGYIKSVDFGIRGSKKLAVSRETGYNWGALCPKSWGGNYANCPTLDGTVSGSYSAADGSTVSSGSSAVSTINSYAELYSYQKIFGNSLPSLWVPSASLAAMSTVTSSALLSSIEPSAAGSYQNWARWISYAAEAGCTGNDMTCLALYENTDGNNSTSNRISAQKQDVYATYMQVNYAHDNFFGLDLPIDGNVGLRIVRTENNVSNGKLVMPTLNADSCTVGTDVGTTTTPAVITSCTQFEAAVAYLGGTSQAGATIDRPAVTNGYTNYLPSFNFRAHISDELQARLAYSQTIVRPDFAYTRNNASLSFNWGDSGTTQAYSFKSDPSGSGGNPSLKPMKASNYDASVEWYFSASGNVTMSLFYKDLKDYIYSSTTSTAITNPYSGETMDFNYTTYVNGSHGKVQGFEVSYQQFYDMLPGAFSGLGFQANYTKIYNSGGHNGAVDVTNSTAISNSNNRDLPLEGMSEDSYNLALLYAKYDIDFRLAYNWRSSFLLSSSGANVNQPVWQESYGQLDSSIFYNFLEHYKIGLQVTNLMATSVYTDTGYADYHPRSNYIDVDRKFSIVLRANW